MKLSKTITSIAAFCFATGAFATESVRMAAMETGTLNWEIATITNNGLDEKNGFSLDVTPMAGDAVKLAFESDQADMMVADLVWVAGQNAAGRDYMFIPYSKNVGTMLVAGDSDAKDLTGLKGKKVGIAGGALDKNWLILNAYAKSQLGFDLAGETEQVFGAPPLIMEAGTSGQVDAALNFWNFQVKMQDAGMKPLINVNEVADSLGLDPETPLLGYVVRREYAEANPEVIKGIQAASREAKNLIATDDAAWNALRDMVKPANDTEFANLRAGFVAGIPNYQPVNIESANRLLQVLSENGGAELVPEGTKITADMFIE